MLVWYYIYPHGFETIITTDLGEALNACASLWLVGQPYVFRSLYTDAMGNPYYLQRHDYNADVE